MYRAGEVARDYFVKAFDKQGWDGKAWTPVKRKVPPPILNVTGKLKSQVQGAKINATESQASVEVHTDYGQYHNDGAVLKSWKNSKSRRSTSLQKSGLLPKRQFTGQTDSLTNQQRQIVIDTIAKAFNA